MQIGFEKRLKLWPLFEMGDKKSFSLSPDCDGGRKRRPGIAVWKPPYKFRTKLIGSFTNQNHDNARFKGV